MTKPLPTIDVVKQQVDTHLESFFTKQVAAARLLDPSYGQLWQRLEALTLAGGKRLRPYLCLLAYQAAGGSENILDIAVAQELLHVGLLIHDDVIDRDLMRYGTKTIAAHYRLEYASKKHATSLTNHLADGAAILGGDLAFNAAFELITNANISAEDKLQTLQTLREAMFAVIGGELLDTEASLQPADQVDALKIARLKTASYSFIGPLTTGAQLAHADPQLTTAFQTYGENLGIAYQLADDVLGAFGDSKQTGKPNTSDFSEAKPTYLLQTALQKPEAAKYLKTVIGKTNITPATAAKIRQTLMDSGALDKTQALADMYADQAVAALQTINMSKAARQTFSELAKQSIRRNK